MQQQTLERRLELLKLEGNGLSPIEIVQDLSVKFGCVRGTIYNDFATKPHWQYILKDEVSAEKNLPPLPLGEGQTLKPSQTLSSFVISIPQQLPEQGQNSSDAEVQSARSEFVVALQKLIDNAKKGALTRAAAIHEAEHLIGNYSRTREQDALTWLQKLTNQPSLQVLPPEMQLQLEAQLKLYLEQFVKIMDDALNAPAK